MSLNPKQIARINNLFPTMNYPLRNDIIISLSDDVSIDSMNYITQASKELLRNIIFDMQ